MIHRKSHNEVKAKKYREDFDRLIIKNPSDRNLISTINLANSKRPSHFETQEELYAEKNRIYESYLKTK